MPTPEGPIPVPIPPNTPGVEPYGEDVVPVEEVPPMEGVVVPVPAVLFRKNKPWIKLFNLTPNAQKYSQN